jgi:hypothetical protein
VVGAALHDDKGMDSGAAYVFVRSGAMWSQQAKLLAEDGAAGDNFGDSVAVAGNTAMMGARFRDDRGTDSGAAYAFVLRLSNGDQCMDLNQCASGFCADGVCCDIACADPCDVCAKSLGASADGTCTNAPAGYATSPSCGVYACDGADSSCPTDCTLDDQCASTRYCAKDGICKPRRMNGSACDATAGGDCLLADCRVCSSGSCVEGLCCDTTCDGACMACSAAKKGSGNDGVCGPVEGCEPGSSSSGEKSYYSCAAASSRADPRPALLAAAAALALAARSRRRRRTCG